MTGLSKDSEMNMMLLQRHDVDSRAEEERQRDIKTRSRMGRATIEAET